MKFLLVALLLVVAPASVFADALPTPEVKLVTAGKSSRKQLRFAPTKGTKRTIVMTSQEAKARGVKGKLPRLAALPAIRTTIDVEVTDVTGDGDVRYQVVYSKAEVVAAKNENPELVRELEAASTP